MRPMREQRWLCNKKLSSLSMLRGRSHVQQVILLNITVEKGSKDVVLVRGVAYHCCGPGSIPGLGVRCGLSLLFAMVFAPQVFIRILQFSSLHKKKTFQIPILPANNEQRKTTLWIDYKQSVLFGEVRPLCG